MAIERQRYPNPPKLQGLGEDEEDINVIVEEEAEPTTDFQMGPDGQMIAVTEQESIQTNSLESHLTRIRKKFEKIKTRTKISTKNDVLSIFV